LGREINGSHRVLSPFTNELDASDPITMKLNAVAVAAVVGAANASPVSLEERQMVRDSDPASEELHGPG